MEIVIDIDENVFTRLFDNGIEDYEIVNDDLFAIAKAIRKGTPLPKGHGRIIDESRISKCEQIGLIIKDGNVNRCFLTDAPTIIDRQGRK